MTEGGPFHVHELRADQLGLATAANEMVFVPVGSHGLDAFVQNGLVTSVTSFSEQFDVTVAAIWLVFVGVELGLGDGFLASVTDEMVRVPTFAQCCQNALKAIVSV